MKSKTPTVIKQPSPTELLLDKRNAFVSERDIILAKLMELDSSIESIDNVITMFDPKHVPLDIPRVQSSAPMLTLTAQPILSGMPSATPTEEKEAPRKARQTSKSQQVVAESPKEPVVDAAAEKAKLKAKKAAKKQKLIDAARDKLRDYFESMDKPHTLEEIIKPNADGIPFRVVCNEFIERYPVDISTSERKKVFSDKISSVLYFMSKQGSVARSERQGPEGKENVWVWTGTDESGKKSKKSETASDPVTTE